MKNKATGKSRGRLFIFDIVLQAGQEISAMQKARQNDRDVPPGRGACVSFCLFPVFDWIAERDNRQDFDFGGDIQ